MRHLMLLGMLALGLGACAGGPPSAGEAQSVVDRSTLAVQELLGGDNDVLNAQSVLRNARGVVICPRQFRVAFIGGGEGGSCVLVGRDGNGSWSSPAFYSMGSGNVGFQAGIQDSQTMLIIRSERALNAVLDGQFTLGADASVAFAVFGGSVQGATTQNLGADILAISRTRGLFAGIALEGSVLSAKQQWNEAFYGRDVSARQIVVHMQAHNPGADPLRSVLTRFSSGQRAAAEPVQQQAARMPASGGAPLAGPVGRTPLPPVAR
jgi:SH3 domain-containing YSC84-like protein 1